MANDRVLLADGTSPRQAVQWNHPGSMLSFASGSAIKRITAGVKAAADRPCQSFDLRPAFTLPAKSVPNEKRILLSRLLPRPLTQNIGRFFGVSQQLDPARQLPSGARFRHNLRHEHSRCVQRRFYCDGTVGRRTRTNPCDRALMWISPESPTAMPATVVMVPIGRNPA